MNVLKPGILVSLKTSLRGGVTYIRKDLDTGEEEVEVEAREVEAREVEAREEEGAPPDSSKPSVRRWETLRRIEYPAEYEAAAKLRSACAGQIRRVCVPTAFGLLCPEERSAELQEAIEAAGVAAREFNARTQSCQVHVYVLRGRIAETDEEAARAISAEVLEIIEDMRRGKESADASAIRQAASRARGLAKMLDTKQAQAVDAAVEAARKAARELTKRVEKDGEDAEAVLREINFAAVDLARFAFLDAGDDAPVPSRAPVAPERAQSLDVGEEAGNAL